MSEARLDQEQSITYSRREFIKMSGAAVVAAGLAACSSTEAEPTAERIELPRYIRSGPADKPNVAITIDDIKGPEGARDVARLLDVATDKKVKFTFFPIGEELERHQRAGLGDVWQRAVAEGHEIGNHTYSHDSVLDMTPRQLRGELLRTQQIFNELLGEEYLMRLMRPPGGAGGLVEGGDPQVMRVLEDLDYSMVMWTTDSRHTAGDESFIKKIMEREREGAANGSIILTHFTTLAPEHFDDLIDALRKEKGLEPTTVTSLFAE